MKSRITESSVNKNQILQWINHILNSNQTKIQSLGNGIAYCLLINHFYPNSIQKNKIIMVPRNSIDNKSNLKKFQQALNLQNIKSISFDIFRVSEMSYLDNWQLIIKIHRHFEEFSKQNQKQQQNFNQLSQCQSSLNTSQNQNLSQSQVSNPMQASNQIHVANQIPALNQMPALNQNSQMYHLPKQVGKGMEFNTGLLTPMKGLKYFDDNAKLRIEALRLMQQIKTIVKSQAQSDKVKVKNLKKMLGLIEQQSQQEQLELKQLFSDCKQKQQVITID